MNQEFLNMPNGGASDKVKTYKWTVKDRPGKYRAIDKNEIHVDETYQRLANQTKALALARDWSWAACGAIIVVERDGKFWAIDGQHRVLGAKNRSDIKTLPCLVFELEGFAEEAQTFLDTNTNRRPLSAIDRFRAQVVSGNATALIVKKTLDECGLIITKSPTLPTHIKCIGSCMYMALNDEAAFRVVMKTAAAVTTGKQVADMVLRGLFHIQTRCEPCNLCDKRVYDRVCNLGAENLIGAAQRAAVFYQSNTPKTWAFGMVEIINKGLRQKIALT